jgi:hypothetical protein
LFSWYLSAALLNVLNDHENGIIRKLVDYNRGGVQEYPYASFGGVDAAAKKEDLEIDKGLQEMGFKHKSSDIAERYGREEATEGDDVLEKPAGGQPGGPGMPGGGGPGDGPGGGDTNDPFDGMLDLDKPERNGQVPEQNGTPKEQPKQPVGEFSEDSPFDPFSDSWEEGKHPRGQPGNAGQFGKGGGHAQGATKEGQAAGDSQSTAQNQGSGRVENAPTADNPHKPNGHDNQHSVDATGYGNSAVHILTKASQFAQAALKSSKFFLDHARTILAHKWQALPSALRLPAVAAAKLSFLSYTAGRKAVIAVAQAKGLSSEQAERVARMTAAADVLCGGSRAATVAAALGMGALSGPAAVVPWGSLSYLAYSTSRDPMATLRVARASVKAARSKLGFDFAEDPQGHEHAAAGTSKGGQFVSKGKGGTTTKDKSGKRPKVSVEQQMSVKALRAKAAHHMVDKTIQRYAEEHNEPKFAKAVGGVSFPNSEAIDIAVAGPDGVVAHGLELKTMVDNKANKITMKRSAMERKAEWERKNKAPFHTVVLDDHAVFNAKGEGKHDESKRRMFYRRGYGSFRVGTMHEFKSIEELKALMATPEKKLPPAARRPAGQKQGRLA